MARPRQSIVRDRLVEIVYFLGKDYAYNIANIYNSIFPKKTQRLIYYHLNFGTKMGLFKVEEDKEYKGSYSWGNSVRRVYYSLGESAKPKADKKIKEAIEKLKNRDKSKREK